MQTKTVRIKNLKRDMLPHLWQELSNQDFSELIERSTPKEISILFGHMSSPSIANTMNFLEEAPLSYIFKYSFNNTINKIISSCNKRILKGIISKTNKETISDILGKCNHQQKETLLSIIPDNIKNELAKIEKSPNHSNIDEEYYSSKAYGDILKNNIIDRIKELEEKEAILEKNYKSKEIALAEKLTKYYTDIEKIELISKQKESIFLKKESDLKEKEIYLNEKIKELEEKHKQQQQERLDTKLTEYVDTAADGLKSKCEYFEKRAFWWNIQGGVALIFAIAAAVIALIYGGVQFKTAAEKNIDWFFFCFLTIKGLIVITLFATWAKHSFNIANAYVHESLKRSDRMHAISFGKFYLEVYGNKVTQEEMKSIFENWNISTDSAFTKIKESEFTSKSLEQIANIASSIQKIKSL